jgi:alkyl sulfatase BDS1-like metallo-beta-lactamase superfamily hydrolase
LRTAPRLDRTFVSRLHGREDKKREEYAAGEALMNASTTLRSDNVGHAEATAPAHRQPTARQEMPPRAGLAVTIALGVAALLIPAGVATSQGNNVPGAAGAANADAAARPKPASEATRRFLRDSTAALRWDDREDFELVERGFIGGIPGNKIFKADGRLSRDLDIAPLYAGPAPETVNPSLWRNAQLHARSGLFKVTDRVYQVRGVELANMTAIVGDAGYVLIDTLTTTEAARASLALIRSHLGDRPVTGVIYTHSHVDHFGGAAGVITADEARQRGVPIVGPQGFTKEAISENVIAGPAMSRRASYAFGFLLSPGPSGQVSDGIGPSFQRQGVAPGTVSLVPPTVEITRTGQTMTIDGVDFEFQLTPNTEAPAEMTLYLPQFRVLDMAELANGSLHNILTLRGAQIRDAKAWADALTEAVRLFGSRTDTLMTSHFWPHWGQAKIIDFLSAQRDAYAYLHDQSVRMMNMGFTGPEIAEHLKLPETLASRWFNQGYYGTLSHNSKAVYQRYLGWYDGNPATLNALPPAEAGKRYVEAMGGPEAVVERGRKAIADGDYRWASELLSRVVFADPDNRAAQLALADSLEQQGYQTTSAMWRSVFLSGAAELRAGGPRRQNFDSIGSSVPSLPLASILDLLSVRLVPERALARSMTFDLVLDGGKEAEHVEIRNGVLIHAPITPAEARNGTIALSRAQFVGAVTKAAGAEPLPEAAAATLRAFMALFEAPAGGFGLVTPRT